MVESVRVPKNCPDQIENIYPTPPKHRVGFELDRAKLYMLHSYVEVIEKGNI